MKRMPLLTAAVVLTVACEGGTGPATPPAARVAADVVGRFTEPAFYKGQLVHFLLPSAGSANPNEQVVADCFRVGPRVPDNVPVGGTAYILLIPGANQEVVCSTTGEPAGALTHNHVLTTAPGDVGYNGHFQLVAVAAGPNYPGAAFADTYDSEAAVLAGLAAGELVIANPDVARTRWTVLLR
ncbi:MAG TPA: hypothetical protein VFQ38_06785 [Longimicrobiales bacterium]|nr:hypothetical protein [Longimicrobiales bacterium]